jgi:iron-sulfur cluster assembly protein
MLAISPAATAVITEALNDSDAPAGAGLRLSTGEPTERGMAIELAFVASAQPEDRVVEAAEGANVFVEPATAELLDDQVLDAEVRPGQITFTLQPQASGGNPSLDGARG